jgi:hypothetical protein
MKCLNSDRKIILFLLFIVALSLSTIRYLDPNRFDQELGPSSTEIWRLNETINNVTLIRIIDSPEKAVFQYNNITYTIVENKWTTNNNFKFKVLIYPEKEFVWFKIY